MQGSEVCKLTFVPSLNAAGRTAFPSSLNDNKIPKSRAPQQTKIIAMAAFNHVEVCIVQVTTLGFPLTTWLMPVTNNTSAVPTTAWHAAWRTHSSLCLTSRFLASRLPQIRSSSTHISGAVTYASWSIPAPASNSGVIPVLFTIMMLAGL
jgi:hypothetical protein